MIETLEIAFYLATLVAAGRAVLSLIPNGAERSHAETAALSILLGCGCVPSAMFILASIGIRPNRWELAATMLISIAILARARRHERKPGAEPETRAGWPRFEWNRSAAISAVCAVVALAGFAVVWSHATLMPAFDVDAYGHWGLKAKVLFHEGLTPDGFFHRLPLSYSHLNYPLLVPFLASGVFAAIGHLDDSSWRAVFPLLYAGGILFMYSSLRWKLSAIPAALLATAFATAPATIRWAGSGLADFPLAAFHAVSIFHLVKYLEEKKTGDFAISALATAFCAFTKNEGLALAALNAAVLAAFHIPKPFSKRKAAEAALFAAALALLTAPYLIWRAGIPNTQAENYTGRLLRILEPENLARLTETARLFAAEMFDPNRWGLLWLMLPLAAVFNLSAFEKRRVLAMWTLLAGHLAIYAMAFMISPWSPKFLADMALDRIILHAAPALIYLLAFHIEPDNAKQTPDSHAA